MNSALAVVGPHPVDSHVGKRLRLRRTILGLSQESVARAIGITFQQVQKYERGVNRMSASRLADFSKVMKVPVSYFFDGSEEIGEFAISTKGGSSTGTKDDSGTKFEHDQLTSRETLEMMRSYYRIKDPVVRKRVADLIKAMAEEQIVGY